MVFDPVQAAQNLPATSPNPLAQLAGQAVNQPQPPQQQQPQAPPQQDDPIAKDLLNRYQTNAVPPTNGGQIKRLLGNFFASMSHGMTPVTQSPDFLRERALADYNTYAGTQANLELHKSMARQFDPVPLVGMDGKPITGPDGKVISLPANHAQTFYAGQAAAAGRINVQGLKNEGSLDVQTLRNQGTAATHPIQQVLNDASQAYANGDMETYNNKLQEASQLSGTATAAARQDKLTQFRATQEYQRWKTNQDNQTKLQVAQMSGDKAPAAIMQTAAFAQGGLSMLNDAKQAMQRLEARGVLGNVTSNKIENWIFGKGLVDPTLSAQDKQDIGKLRAAATYTSSAAMRAHTGRSSREIYDDFKTTMGINQGPDAWKGAMEETENMLGQYSQGATDASIRALRGRPASPIAPTPSGGATNAPSVRFTEGSDTYNIPADKVAAFKAKHPQAVPSGR